MNNEVQKEDVGSLMFSCSLVKEIAFEIGYISLIRVKLKNQKILVTEKNKDREIHISFGNRDGIYFSPLPDVEVKIFVEDSRIKCVIKADKSINIKKLKTVELLALLGEDDNFGNRVNPIV